MRNIHDFNDMIQRTGACERKVRVAVVRPDDVHTREVIERCKAGNSVAIYEVHGEPEEASRRAVDMVRRGEADVLMKGLVSTDTLLRAVLDKERGLLPRGRVMSHVTVVELPCYHKLLLCSDVAVIPFPTAEQLEAMLEYDLRLCRMTGRERPKVALLHCNEKESEKFPITLAYRLLKEKACEGVFGPVEVDGPMDVKTACDAHSAQVKGIESTVAGDADILLFPDIEAGNTFYKTVTLFAKARTASLLTGTCAPVVVPSRADNAKSKYYSLMLACMMAAETDTKE